ncbi:calcium-binding protein [Falsiroseomonas sp.]|uniref:calcium-binding protein n=1 Tax=Falsiroseomonas sp. TaxID=2870721 RepID=UPI003F705D23
MTRTTPSPQPLEEAALAAVAGGAQILGSGQGEQLIGTAEGDLMAGNGGHDRILGGAGADMIGGGEGHDQVMGGDGDDTLAGGRGADRVDGGAGSDTILWQPGEGNDTLRGGEDADGGIDTLRMELTGLTPEQLVAAMTLAEGSALPVIRDGWIDVTGVTGSITIGGETLSFAQFERLELASATGPSYGR